MLDAASLYGFMRDGVYATDGDAIARDAGGNVIYTSEGKPLQMSYHSEHGNYIFQGGDTKYRDINHDGIIDKYDVVNLGNPYPRFTGGFGSSLEHGPFRISISFSYRAGYRIINQTAWQSESLNSKLNQSKKVLYRWRMPGNDEPGMLQRAYMYNTANALPSDDYVEKGRYLRLNRIGLEYRFTPVACERLHLSSLQVGFSIDKLFTLTNYSGVDPEIRSDISSYGWWTEDQIHLPSPRMYSLSIQMRM